MLWNHLLFGWHQTNVKAFTLLWSTCSTLCCFSYLYLFVSLFCELYTMQVFSFICPLFFLPMFICSFPNPNPHVFLTHNFSISFPSLSLSHQITLRPKNTFLPSSIVFLTQLQFLSISSCRPIHLVDYLFICRFICFFLYLFSEVPAFSLQGANLALIDDLISFAFALMLLESQIITWNNSKTILSPNRINYGQKKMLHNYIYAFSCCNIFTCVYFSYLLKKGLINSQLYIYKCINEWEKL